MSQPISALTRVFRGVSLFVLAVAPGGALAADVTTKALAPAVTNQTFSAEFFTGYLAAEAREYVYNMPQDTQKISQLNWQIDNAAVIGGRLGYRPLDWLSVHAEGWTTISSSNAMDDFDWFDGYNGFNSWTNWSHSRDTDLSTSIQLDMNFAARVFQHGPFALHAMAGYRFTTMKWNANGGHYIYSNSGFREDTGVFPDTLGIAYQQWWSTPYLGIGVAYNADAVKISGALIGSPLVSSHDKDHHNLRSIVFKEDFDSTSMLGASLGLEYAVTSNVSLTGRAEYQRYYQAKGATLMLDGAQETLTRTQKPAAGADYQSLLLTVGLKTSL